MKKMLPLALVVGLLGGLLSACSSGGKEEGKPDGESAAGEKVTLNMTVLPDDLETFQQVYSSFKQDNPDIEVKFDTIPQKQYYEKLRLQLSSGEPIDLFGGNMDVFLDTGIIEPLDSYIKSNNVDVSGYGPLYDEMKINGQIFSLPYRKSTWILYYNKTLFDQMKVPYPKDDMTWAEFRELAKQMTKGEGADKIYGAFLQPWAQTWYLQAVQHGASVIDKDLSPFKDALQFRMDMEKDGSIMSWSEQITTSAHYNAAFQKGNVAMNLIGDWHVAQLRTAEEEKKIDFDWDIVPVPHPEGVPAGTSMATPVSIMINSKSKHKEAAFKLLEYMTGPKGAKQFAANGFLTGYMNDEIKQIYMGDASKKPANIHYLVEQREYPEYPLLPGTKKALVDAVYRQEGEVALTGGQTAEQAIQKIAERVRLEWADKYGEFAEQEK
ncbi:ABC transporter substrate-binding protein [Paenibacillus sp. GCM10027626]|uniref:ABC transporter substrate-binding protein n=1 Tax=Paenibacillus sp. GCM10027626 TaxID=3273411 RepID=UPI0036435422